MNRATLSPTLRNSLQRTSPLLKELSVFLVFLFLTVLMTWPWILNLRDAASDPGDPYFASWVLWWDYHQTFHHPLRLFQGNIFFPYHYTLAFSEHHYGIALFMFPLFALGLAPLTVHGIATLLSLAFCGYGAFRLGRTLTGSIGVAWIAGIVYAFIPYRFGQLPHLVYLSAGWIPMVLEALVLFSRRSSKRRAVWLGVTFFLNGLASIHWFLLTLLPLGLSLVVLISRNNGWRNAALWRRGFLAVSIACLALLPFLIPYYQVTRLYGFVRSPDEALFYSAVLRDWMVGEGRSYIWRGLNTTRRAAERSLFPGFLPPLLSAAAILLVGQRTNDSEDNKSRLSRRRILIALDFIIFASAIVAIIISGYGFFKLRVFGLYLLKIYRIDAVACVFVLALITRITIAYPKAFVYARRDSLRASFQTDRRTDAFWLGVIWTVLGFFGSLGMNFIFHRALYEYVPLFRSIRVPARWATICYLGLALLAGIGAKQIADRLSSHWSRVTPTLVIVVIALALLFEQRVAPLNLIKGESQPDALAMKLKQTPMSGGIVELPYGEGKPGGFVYTLRAADHGQPLVTATSGFTPPIQHEIQVLSETHPIPDKLMDVLESLPCSYFVMHDRFLQPEERPYLEDFLRLNTTKGRLRFISSYGEADLFAVTKVEPNAQTETRLPSYLTELQVNSNVSAKPYSPIDDPQFFMRVQYLELLGREPDRGGLDYWLEQFNRCGESPLCLRETRVNVSTAFFSSEEFQQRAFLIYHFYKRVLGRAPIYSEFVSARSLVAPTNLENGKTALLNELMRKKDFVNQYPSNLGNAEFIDRLIGILKHSGVDPGAQQEDLIKELSATPDRAKMLLLLIEKYPLTPDEYTRASILIKYFLYLERDPDPDGYFFWVSKIDPNDRNADRAVIQAFVDSDEYRARFRKR